MLDCVKVDLRRLPARSKPGQELRAAIARMKVTEQQDASSRNAMGNAQEEKMLREVCGPVVFVWPRDWLGIPGGTSTTTRRLGRKGIEDCGNSPGEATGHHGTVAML